MVCCGYASCGGAFKAEFPNIKVAGVCHGTNACKSDWKGWFWVNKKGALSMKCFGHTSCEKTYLEVKGRRRATCAGSGCKLAYIK